MKKFFLSHLIFISLHTVAQSDSIPSFVKDNTDNYVTKALDNWQIPGAAVCIIKNGKVVLLKGFGVKELNGSNKVDENSLFMIGSNC